MQRARKKLASWHATGCKRMQSLHTTGGQSHINWTRVASSRMLIVPAWPPVAWSMNKIDGNLHATVGHAGTICMQLAATLLQFACDWRPLRYNLHATGGHSVTRQETSRQEACKRPPLHHNYIFWHWQVHILDACFRLFSWRSLDTWFGKCSGTMDDIATQKQILHALAASCVQSRQFFASTWENNYLNKKMKTPLKIWESTRHMSLISAVHQHYEYAWPDPIS